MAEGIIRERADHSATIKELHALKRSDHFIGDATGLTLNAVREARKRLNLPAIPKAEQTDIAVEQRSPAYVRWLEAKKTPGGVQKLLQEAKEAFLEDNGIMFEIAADAGKAKAEEDAAMQKLTDWRNAYDRKAAIKAYLAELTELTAQNPPEPKPRPVAPRKPYDGSRRGPKPVLSDEQILSVSHLSISQAALALGVGKSTIQRSRDRLRGRT